MPIDFKLPDLGENIKSGDVVNVLVREGDVITANQPVAEIETDKAVVEVPSPQAGRVAKVHIKPGQTVPIGGVLITIETEVGAVSPAPPTAKSAPAAKPAFVAPAQAPAPAAPPTASVIPTDSTWSTGAANASGSNGGAPLAPAPIATAVAEPQTRPAAEPIAAGPAIRRLARELGIDLAHVHGTGEAGRITRDDVVSAVRNATGRAATGASGAAAARAATPPGATDQDAWGTVRREKLTKIRKTIAANMVRSKNTIPHVTNFDEADVTELERIRKGSQQDYNQTNVKLTMTVFVMKAVAHALKMNPTLNATLDDEREQIIYKEYVNLGVAVDTERGLVVPVVRNVDRLTLPQVAYALTEVSSKARASQFSPDDLRGGSFTISNLGAVGGIYSTPIINHPEVAILLTGRARKLPVVVDDKIEARLMMPLSLSYDHRLVDGAAAARFLNDVIGFLQAPGRLLLAP